MRTKKRSRSFGVAMEMLEPRIVLDAGPLITEFMAINNQANGGASTLRDEDRDTSDWIELHNPTDAPVDLSGWYLTDEPENLSRWQLPSLTLAPGEYRVIYASGKDRVDPASNLHTNFRLSGSGEFLALVDADGSTIRHAYAPQFPEQRPNVSYGLAEDMTTPFFFTTPSPGAANTSGFVAVVETPRASAGRGFFDAPVDLELTTGTPDAQIRYTLDGSRPTAATGLLYEGPIHVDATTTLRAVAFKENYMESDVTTQSYLFLQDVLDQPARPEGFPTEWVLEDGEVRPAVYDTLSPAVEFHQETILDDLKSVPTLSLVMNVNDMFGPGCSGPPATGDYCGAYNSGGANIDRPTSVEMIFPDGREGFQIDAGIRLQGGSSRIPGVVKRSMRLLFTAEFGPTKLVYPLFEDSPVDTFDTVILRANVQDGWGRGAAGQRQLVKDEFARRSQLAMGQPSAHGTWTHVYINGLYWGLYNLVERPNASFGAEHLGGNKADWDAINGGRLRDGNLEAWDAMLALTPRGGPDVRNFDDAKVRANYEAIQEFVDVPGFIDYVLVGMYMGTEDWLPNNYYAARRSRDGDQPVDPDDPAARFRFFHWDQEKALLGVDKFKNLPSFNSPVGRLFQFFRLSDEFHELQAQRIYDHFYNGGALSPEAAAARYQGLVDEVKDAIKGEAIRWGQTPSNVPDWEADADFIINTLIPGRREGVLDLYRQFRLYPNTDAPVFSQQGGQIVPTQSLEMTAAEGTIYYTLDGSDPRLLDGTVSPNARTYSQPISLSETSLVRARTLANDEWSVYNHALFLVGEPASPGTVVISEINYNPAGPTSSELEVDPGFQAEDFEWVEIYNSSDQPVDLAGVRLTEGIDFTFPAFDASGQHMQLQGGEYAVLVSNTSAFAARYGEQGTRVIGRFSGRLDNLGERIRVEGPLGTTWLDFAYDDADDWPQRADGDGATLVLIDPDGTEPHQFDNSAAWDGSHVYGGTPGRAAQEPIGVVINEVLARTDRTTNDSIELYNASTATVDLGDWFLSDSSNNFFKYQIPAGTTIEPGGYVVFDEGQFNPNPANPAPEHFGLSGTEGDDVWLVIPSGDGGITSFVDDVHFGATPTGESLGRFPNGSGRMAPMSAPSLGRDNGPPRVGPVVISEFHYHPPAPSSAALALDPQVIGDDLEFVEIYNPTDNAIDLTNWQIQGGIEFDLDPGTQLPPGQTMVIVSFNPAAPRNVNRLAAFRAQYGLDPNVMLVGGYQGQLSNSGELVRLLRAEATDGATPAVRVLEDEVIYDDGAPWPVEADAAGASLARTAIDAWGNSSSSWTPGEPSPGTTSFTTTILGDSNGDGGFDQRDIDAVLGAGKYMTGTPAALAEGDWNGDGVFDQRDIVAVLQAGDFPSAFGAVGGEPHGAASIVDDWFAALGRA